MELYMYAGQPRPALHLLNHQLSDLLEPALDDTVAGAALSFCWSMRFPVTKPFSDPACPPRASGTMTVHLQGRQSIDTMKTLRWST